jgi:hypothetical protein
MREYHCLIYISDFGSHWEREHQNHRCHLKMLHDRYIVSKFLNIAGSLKLYYRVISLCSHM